MISMFNQSGQGFSVFKLLISAVIAVAILYILMSILGVIEIGNNEKPQEQASKLITTLAQDNAFQDSVKKVVFGPNSAVTNRGTASATNTLDDNQVCVLAGDFVDDPNFRYIEGVSVIYTGTSERAVSLAGICDTGRVLAENTDYFSQYAPSISEDWVGDCGCVDEQNNQKCCIVALKRFLG
jgi:hypothetical protein